MVKLEDKFTVQNKNETYHLEHRQVPGEEHYCMSIALSNKEHSAEKWINPIRIYNATDNCKSCCLIVKNHENK